VTTKVKIVIAVIVVSLILLVALVALVIFIGSDKDYARQYSAALAEGREVAKQTDQEGCIQRGMARLKGVADPTVTQLAANDAFMSECLKLSRSSTAFCDGVPSVPYQDWIAIQCEKLQRSDQICFGVFDAKHSFCNGL
jgi:hypothetical protein